MRTSSAIVSLFIVVRLAAGCGRVGAQTVDAAAASPPAPPTPSSVSGVAGNCPADDGPLRPADAGDMADLNRDGYVCTKAVRSMAGDTLRITVDNDVPTLAWVLPQFYVGM